MNVATDIRLAAVVLAVALLSGGCVEQTVSPPRSLQNFVFWPESIVVVEGRRSVTGRVRRISDGDSAGVMVRTVSESPADDSLYFPMTAVLLFGRSDTMCQFQVSLMDNSAADGDRHFTVHMDPHYGFDAITRPTILDVTVLDDEILGPPRAIAWPLSTGRVWEYSVTGTTELDEGRIVTWKGIRTDRIERVVRFKGQDFYLLEGGEDRTDIGILLRQEGSVLYYALVNDTTDDVSGSLRHRLRDTLPWVLVDFGEGPGEARVHFAFDTTGDGGYRRDLTYNSKFLRRSAVVAPSGVYRDVAVVKFAWSWSESGNLYPARGESESRTLYISDSVGVVRQTCSYFRYEYSVGIWWKTSWDAQLLPQQRL